MRERWASFRLVGVGVALIVAGCATDDGPGGDPGSRPLPAGYTCNSVRAELNRLDGQGARSSVEAAGRGQKLSPNAQAQADRYNLLLSYYLGGRCHV